MTEVLVELETPDRTVPASAIEAWYDSAVETGDIVPKTDLIYLSDKINALEEAGLIKAKRVND